MVKGQHHDPLIHLKWHENLLHDGHMPLHSAATIPCLRPLVCPPSDWPKSATSPPAIPSTHTATVGGLEDGTKTNSYLTVGFGTRTKANAPEAC